MTVQFKSILCKELSDFLGFREKTLSKSAYCHDRLYLQRLDKYLCSGKYSTKELSEECLTGWINTLSGKTVTIANEVIVIRLFLEFLKSLGIPAYTPPVPKVHDDYIPYIFSDAELDSIFVAADSLEYGKSAVFLDSYIEFPMVLRLMYGCGLRVGETVSLKMEDVDLDTGVLTLKRTKRNKQRLVPMHTSLMIVLKKYCMAMGIVGEPNAFLFPCQTKDSSMSPHTAQHRFEFVLRNADIFLPGRQKHQRGPCLHCLRHVFAFKSFTNAERAGTRIDDSIPYLSIYLGHDRLRETEKYLRFSNEMFPGTMDLFENYTAGVFPEVTYEE